MLVTPRRTAALSVELADALEPVAVPVEDPVALEPEVEEPVPVAVADESEPEEEPVVSLGVPEVVKKFCPMQFCTQSPYAWVSAAEPLPWLQPATHWLVALACEAEGSGTC